MNKEKEREQRAMLFLCCSLYYLFCFLLGTEEPKIITLFDLTQLGLSCVASMKCETGNKMKICQSLKP